MRVSFYVNDEQKTVYEVNKSSHGWLEINCRTAVYKVPEWWWHSETPCGRIYTSGNWYSLEKDL